MANGKRDECVAIHWYRHGLRTHDCPALLDSMERAKTIYPVFIFDGRVAGTWHSGYNRWRFLLESLKDLDEQYRRVGGRLWIFHGDPREIFERLVPHWGVTHLSYELDLEPIWQERDCFVRTLLEGLGVEIIERVSYTLWDPREIIRANGGSPPLTFGLFMLTASTLGEPETPVSDPDFDTVLLKKDDDDVPEEFRERNHVPTLEEMGVDEDISGQKLNYVWKGGETHALENMSVRLEEERKAFVKGQFQSHILNPNLVRSSRSLSPYFRFGCLSVRLFYHRIMELCRNEESLESIANKPAAVSAQLIWREYFYTMSINNPHFAEIKDNPVCLPIPWLEDDAQFKLWKEGKTGYPWIDALQRQLILEGWTHHVGRHAVACFLTRGDLWLSWVPGALHFIKYQIDGDWAVGIGNWMWVSSSAFEKALDCSKCMCPVNFGRRMDPEGEFVKKYVPEVRDIPLRYLFSPWKAPLRVQEEARCVIGKDYPFPMVDHKFVSKRNSVWMEDFKKSVVERMSDHIRPTTFSEEELKLCGLSTHSNSCKACQERSRPDDDSEDYFLMD